MHSRATIERVRPNARENSQIRPSTIVRTARAAGSQPHLASGFQGRCKIATLHAGFGVIRGMSDKFYHYVIVLSQCERRGEKSTVRTIAEWLASLGLSEYAQRFADNYIDASVLPDLT